MKLKALPVFVAVAIALPAVASAMNADQQVHTDKARAIFEIIASEQKGDKD
jgi:hypothetical protein